MDTLSKDVQGFVDTVVSYLHKKKKIQHEVPDIRKLFHRVTARAKNEKAALVETAILLTTEEQEKIKALLVKLVGHEVTLTNKVNKMVLGGMRIQIADWLVDTSLSAKLTDMASTLTQ